MSQASTAGFVWLNMFHVIYRLLVFSFDDRAAVFSILSEISNNPPSHHHLKVNYSHPALYLVDMVVIRYKINLFSVLLIYIIGRLVAFACNMVRHAVLFRRLDCARREILGLT